MIVLEYTILIFLCVFFEYKCDLVRKNCDIIGNMICLIDGINSLDNLVLNNSFIYSALMIIPTSRIPFEYVFKISNQLETRWLILSNFKRIKLNFKMRPSSSFYDTTICNSDFLFDFDSINQTSFQQDFFNQTFTRNVEFYSDVVYYLNVSTIYFKNSDIDSLSFQDLSNSSLKVNYFTFKKDTQSRIQLNSRIKCLILNVFRLRISNEIINEYVFENTNKFVILNYADKFEEDLFKSFKNLKHVELSIYGLKKFLHKGTKWIKYLNYANTNKSIDSFKSVCYLSLFQLNIFNYDVQTKIEAYNYPDEDFCLFKDFPHNQSVFPILGDCFSTCTYVWLIQYYLLYPKSESLFNCEYNIRNLTCDFEVMLKNCLYNIDNQMNDAIYEINPNADLYYELYEKNYHLKQIDFILSIFILPLVCFLGIFFNILCIVVLSNKDFMKAYKDRMYKQMLVYSIVNFFVCIIYFLRLTIKCIDPITSFCPVSILTNKSLRTLLLIIVFYIGSAFKTWSNLIQISIAFDRFILSTDSKRTLFKKFSKISLKWLFLFFLLFSLIINFVNLYEYDFNIYFQSIEFPKIDHKFFDFNNFYSYWNIINITFSNFLILFIQSILDVGLFFFIRQSIKKKNAILLKAKANQNKSTIDAKNREKKIKLMIICNGLNFFILHSPDFIISVFMARIDFTVYKKLVGPYNQNLDNYTLFDNLLGVLADIFYIFGFSLNFFIFYHLNSPFNRYFHSIFITKCDKV
jgi:hypothetical protein